MLKSEIQNLPSSAELPCSDDTPVDNEEQNFIPNFLLFLLDYIWGDRRDWFFGVDMAVYHTTGDNPRTPVTPDGFLALNVERRKGGQSRRSYAVWEENNVVPVLVLEVVSKTPGGEYDSKEEIYAQLGVLYYVVYNPQQFGRGNHYGLEVYKLVKGRYSWQPKEPVWMPEIGLGIGRATRDYKGIQREVLYWFDEEGNRYCGTEEELEVALERADREQQRADREQQRADREQQRAEQERERADREQQRAEQERERAESAQQQVEQERQRADREQQLREQLQRELERYRQQLGDLPED